MCDHCNSKSKNLVTVNIVTGKRGRPPKKDFCPKCLKSEKGSYNLPGEKPVKVAVTNPKPPSEPKQVTPVISTPDTCDGCKTETGPFVTVNLVTNRRGRPPKRAYCPACMEANAGSYRLAGDKPVKGEKTTGAEIRTIAGFDTAAIFLLNMNFENLFERADTRNETIFRCKGCRGLVNRNERKPHFADHRKSLKAA